MAELISCPECKKHLQVPEELLGTQVQCPECKNTFTATLPDYSGPITKPPALPKETKKPQWEDDPPKKKRKDTDAGFNRDYDDDDAPRRRRRSSREFETPHRGGMIFAFGLVGLIAMGVFPVGLIFAILAWVMGNGDMSEIRTGRMDPEGEGMTQAGRIMGIVSTILHILSIIGCCGYFACVTFFVAAAGAGRPPPPRRRF